MTVEPNLFVLRCLKWECSVNQHSIYLFIYLKACCLSKYFSETHSDSTYIWLSYAFFVVFSLNWARISVIAHIPVVKALTAMSGSAEDIFLIGTTTVLCPPPSNCFNILSWYAHLSLKSLLMSAVFLCHIAMATGWHVWMELSVSRWRSSFIRFSCWEFLQHIQLQNSSSPCLSTVCI